MKLPVNVANFADIRVKRYPGLFWYDTVDKSRLAVLSHLFATLGNGYTWVKGKPRGVVSEDYVPKQIDYPRTGQPYLYCDGEYLVDPEHYPMSPSWRKAYAWFLDRWLEFDITDTVRDRLQARREELTVD